MLSTSAQYARGSRFRPWIASAAAGVLFASGLVSILPFILVAIGDRRGAGPWLPTRPCRGTVRPIARRPRNAVLGVVLIAAMAVVTGQPQLGVPLVGLFGLDRSGLAVTCLAAVALALPLAMADAGSGASTTGWFVLTRRNLTLSLTIFVIVPTWYGERGLSLVPIGVVVLILPPIIGFSRLVAARRRRLDYGLLRRPFRAGLGPQLLQLANMALLCAMLIAVHAGVYNPVALQLTPGLHRVLLIAFGIGQVALLILSLVPLHRVRLGSNLLVTAATIFLAVQLISVYRPPVDAVTIGTPLVGEWWVGHGGHAELVNYHHTRSTQRDALDIMQVVDGSIHHPDSTELASYYIYDQPVLAPASGTVTYVVDEHLDLPMGSVDEPGTPPETSW